MSRIGKEPVVIPSGVTVTSKDNTVVVKGPKGELTQTVSPIVTIAIEAEQVVVTRPDDERESRSLHGLTRSLIANMVEGVTNGYSKTLNIVGVGYRAQAQGKGIKLQLGFSHDVDVAPIEGIDFEVPNTTTIVVKGIDKQQVGQIAANIRMLRPPEPYKGKGIKYSDEVVARKSGKAAG